MKFCTELKDSLIELTTEYSCTTFLYTNIAFYVNIRGEDNELEKIKSILFDLEFSIPKNVTYDRETRSLVFYYFANKYDDPNTIGLTIILEDIEEFLYDLPNEAIKIILSSILNVINLCENKEDAREYFINAFSNIIEEYQRSESLKLVNQSKYNEREAKAIGIFIKIILGLKELTDNERLLLNTKMNF